MPVNVHEVHRRLCPEEVIVQGGDFQPVVKQCRHDWIHLFLQQYQISHHDVIPAVAFGQGEPSAETEGRRHRVVCDRDMQIVARDIDL